MASGYQTKTGISPRLLAGTLCLHICCVWDDFSQSRGTGVMTWRPNFMRDACSPGLHAGFYEGCMCPTQIGTSPRLRCGSHACNSGFIKHTNIWFCIWKLISRFGSYCIRLSISSVHLGLNNITHILSILWCVLSFDELLFGIRARSCKICINPTHLLFFYCLTHVVSSKHSLH